MTTSPPVVIIWIVQALSRQTIRGQLAGTLAPVSVTNGQQYEIEVASDLEPG